VRTKSPQKDEAVARLAALTPAVSASWDGTIAIALLYGTSSQVPLCWKLLRNVSPLLYMSPSDMTKTDLGMRRTSVSAAA